MALLEAKNLGISFGGLRAVDDFNIKIEKGSLYGLIGPNGAGKTTVFNLLTGVYKPTEGIITLDGKDVTGKKTIEINQAGIARTFQNIRLFKDEVRRVGRSMGISEQLIGRHPFPGPGLAIRILGDITPEKVEILQNVDKIYIDSLRAAGLYDQVWQAGAVLLPVKSVGVMGDERTYESCVALRAVTSTDGMTADWVHLPYEFLANVSNDIINKVKGVNRVVYDISSKPPATIEWE